jgi:hypothetical protein
MNHLASPDFWYHYRQLPDEIRDLADKNFAILRADPRHPSLRFKKVGNYWSVRVGLHFRALAKERSEGLVWFWIGNHDDYVRQINS